jgi:hypothetical protein
LQVDGLQSLDFHVVDLRELTHLTSATAMRLSLPIA